MGFRFRFEQLLDYRRHILEKAERDFCRALEKVRKVEKECHQIEDRKKSCEKLLYEKRCQGLSAHEHEILTKNLDGLEWRAKEVRKRLEEAIKELEKQREKLVEAKKRLEMLETLKSEELAEYKRSVTKKEQKLADEVATIRLTRES